MDSVHDRQAYVDAGTPGLVDAEPAPADAGPEDAGAGPAHRLRARAQRQLALLSALASRPPANGGLDLIELRELAAGMWWDAQTLLLISGIDPDSDDHQTDVDGTHPEVPAQAGPGDDGRGPGAVGVPVQRVLDDVVAVTGSQHRLWLRTAPIASLTPAAARELGHVTGELVCYIAARYPRARLILDGYVHPDGAVQLDLTAQVTSQGPDRAGMRRDPDAPGPRRARTAAMRLIARSRVGLRLDLPRFPGGGSAATLLCPATATTVRIQPPADPPHAGGQASRAGVHAIDQRAAGGALSAAPTASVDQEDTPIFKELASAWFQAGRSDRPEWTDHDDDAGLDDAAPASDLLQWDTVSDRVWQASAARMTRPVALPLDLASGLPRRQPGAQLIPRPRPSADRRVPERSPAGIRHRLTTWQDHRARARVPDSPPDR